jgi:ABC-2 type transport system ATP-binding protein
MAGCAIESDDLTKFYGKSRGVIGLGLQVREGEVFGYLGPNGAGKTTTIRLLMGFIRPTRGRAMVLGRDAQSQSVALHRHTGYLPGELALYENMTGADYLRYQASLRGGVQWAYVRELASRLEANLSAPIRSLSHGNKHKIGLIQAFMHRPELIILDEPTQGLDPLVQQEFYRLVLTAKGEGRTVFLSSHVLPEVERVCDRVGIIREGKLIAVEEVSVLKARALRQLEIHFATPVRPEAFAHLAGVRDLSVEDGILRCTVVGSLDALVKAAARFEVVNIVSHEPSLEEVFLAYYGGDSRAA